jgi:hypothetical protein
MNAIEHLGTLFAESAVGLTIAFTAGCFDTLSPPREPLKTACLVRVLNYLHGKQCKSN